MTIWPLFSFLGPFVMFGVFFVLFGGYFCIFLGEKPWGHFCIFFRGGGVFVFFGAKKVGAILYF
jgi:hypothetical protein